MESDTPVMRFGSDTPLLEAPALIAIAVAVIAFIVWLAAGTRDPNAFDVLKWIVAVLIGTVCIAYAGSWHEVVVDASSRTVTERHGFLQCPVGWLGQQLTFSDIAAVVVAQKTDKTTERATSMSQSTRTVYRKSYALSLVRADTSIAMRDGTKMAVPHYALDLPVKERGDPLPLEAMARQLAKLGRWPARRRGYALSAGYGDRAYTIESLAHDAESEIADKE
ncbi:MAG TPA: hypothetical protein VHP37_11295 [Burkholderiales bacterium]|nr:hypothetical protein [Burkholderiales bacterium]